MPAGTPTDVFGFRSPDTDDPATVPADIFNLADDVETALMAILGQERTVARGGARMLSGTIAANNTYAPPNGSDDWTDGALASAVTKAPQASALWRPTQGLLLPMAGLKSILTLRCWAIAGETDPALASGEVLAQLKWVTGDPSAAAGQLRLAHDGTLDSGGAQSLSFNAPVVTGNGVAGESTDTYTVDAAADLEFLGSTTHALCPVLTTSAGFAMAASSVVYYGLELTHKYADID